MTEPNSLAAEPLRPTADPDGEGVEMAGLDLSARPLSPADRKAAHQKRMAEQQTQSAERRERAQIRRQATDRLQRVQPLGKLL